MQFSSGYTYTSGKSVNRILHDYRSAIADGEDFVHTYDWIATLSNMGMDLYVSRYTLSEVRHALKVLTRLENVRALKRRDAFEKLRELDEELGMDN